MEATPTPPATPVPSRRRRFWPDRRAFPTGLLGALLLVASAEEFVARRGAVFQDPVCFSWVFSARAAQAESVGADVLILGDSLAKHGLVPSVIEAATGGKAYNLAVAAGPVPVTEQLLRKALGAGALPSAVVFDMEPGLLSGGPRYRLREWQEILSPVEALVLARTTRGGGGEFAAELALGLLLPTFRARHEVRAGVRETLAGDAPRLAALNAICRRNWTRNAGANVATPTGRFDGAVTEAQHGQYLSARFSAHRVNAASARRLLDLAAARGVRAYLLIPPVAPALRERQAQTGAAGKYGAFLKDLQAAHPALTVLDASESGYPATVFVDPIHLDARGAVTLSSDVGSALRDDAKDNPARWVRLPAYRETIPPAPLEDVEHSREALGIAVLR